MPLLLSVSFSFTSAVFSFPSLSFSVTGLVVSTFPSEVDFASVVFPLLSLITIFPSAFVYVPLEVVPSDAFIITVPSSYYVTTYPLITIA